MNKTNKCFECNNKLGLFHFDCKCEKMFCTKCRYPEIHKCTFDFKKDGRKKLEEQLIKVTAKKIDIL